MGNRQLPKSISNGKRLIHWSVEKIFLENDISEDLFLELKDQDMAVLSPSLGVQVKLRMKRESLKTNNNNVINFQCVQPGDLDVSHHRLAHDRGDRYLHLINT